MIFDKYVAIDLVPAALTGAVVVLLWARRTNASRSPSPDPGLAGLIVFAAAFLPTLLRRWNELPFQAVSTALVAALALALALPLSAPLVRRAWRGGSPRPAEAASSWSALVFLPALVLFPAAYAAVASSTFASGSRYHEDLSFYVNLHHRIVHVGDYFSTVWGDNYFSHHLNPVQFLLAIPSQFGVAALFLARAVVLTMGLVFLLRLARLDHGREANDRAALDSAAPLAAMSLLHRLAATVGHWSSSAGTAWAWMPCFGFALLLQTVTNQAYDELLFYGTVPAALFYHMNERPRPFLVFAAVSAVFKETVILLLLGFFLDNLLRKRGRTMIRTSLAAVLGYLLAYSCFYAISGIDMRILEFNRLSVHLGLEHALTLTAEKALVGGILLAALPTAGGCAIVALPAFVYLLTPIPGFAHPMSHHCTILWAVLLSNFVAFWRPASRLDALRTALALPVGFALLAVSGAPSPFPSESRRAEIEAIQSLVPPSASVVTTMRLSPLFADRATLLILERRPLWKRPPHDHSAETMLIYETAVPPSRLLALLGPWPVPVGTPDASRSGGELTLLHVPTDVFWAALARGPRLGY